MRPIQNQTPNHQKTRLPRRAFMLGGLQAATALIIGARMYHLGVMKNDQYRLLAEENRISIRLLSPSRGLIYDRNGDLVARNAHVYTVEMISEQVQDPEKILHRLAQIIPLSQAQMDKVMAEIAKQHAFIPVTIASDLRWEDIAAISANAPSLPGIIPRLGFNREYPVRGHFCHIIGYVGAVSVADLERDTTQDPLLRIPDFKIGKVGIEESLEHSLRGAAGSKQVEVNSTGRVIRELSRIDPSAGINAQITIGRDLQTFALAAMGDYIGSAVVMDIKNGDILALASTPTFDPNVFLKPLSQETWTGLNDARSRPLINKAISGIYPPGSTFKMVVALCALEHGLVSLDEKISCNGGLDVSNRRFHCWKKNGHGAMTLRRALRESCDVFFYTIALRLGIEKISETANQLGLGVMPDLDLSSVKQGLTPTKAWKQRIKQEGWYPGDTANSSIGQGFVLATPLQLAIMTARLASGRAVKTRLINAVGGKMVPVGTPAPLAIKPEHLQVIREGMFDVSNHKRGTAFYSRIKEAGKEMAGKTGTSQVRRIAASERQTGVIKNKDLQWNQRDHALFVGFAPYDNPRYAISVVVEHGGSGSATAAPIARDIMTKTLNLSTDGYGDFPKNKSERI